MGSLSTSSRLLTHLVDERAEHQPDSLYCKHPISHEADCEWRSISYQQLARAVNRVAWWIDHKLPEGKQQVLAYVGTNDLRYMAFILACMKTGNTALLLSTRNSLPAFRHLLLATNCSVLVDGSERTQLVGTVDEIETNCSDFGLERWRLDSIWDIFSSSPVEPYPHHALYCDIEDRPAIIIHSSGTTGLPKPVPVSHGYLATLDHMQTLPVPPGRKTAHMASHYGGQMRFMHGPLFHFIGLVCMCECIFYQSPFLLAPDRPLTPKLFARIMATDIPPKFALVAPFILESIRVDEEGRQALARLSGLNFGGASLSSATGDDLSSLFRLQTMLGSSETGYTPTLLCEDPADWNYFEWNPAFAHRMEEVGEGLWELVLPRPSSRRYHAIFHSHPNLKEYRTGDLFEPHHSKPNLWRSKGRGDDIVVLSNGEKFNPIDAERLLETHPFVQYAIIIGQDRFQAALLIEPTWDELPATWARGSLPEDLKRIIDRANDLLPGHGQIHQTHIAFSSPDRPFSLTGKGSLRRRATLQMYNDLIDVLYDSAAGITKTITESVELQGSTLEDAQQWVQAVVGKILSRSSIELEDNIVDLGMDSLQALRLVRELQDAAHSMGSSHSQEQFSWTSATVYEKSTIRLLAQALFQQIHGLNGDDVQKDSLDSWPRDSRLAYAVWQLVQSSAHAGKTVVLTGSTGELGTYLLHELLRDPSIKQIYCLNRSADAQARQLSSFREKQLVDGWLTSTSRVHFWQTQPEKEYLGLNADEYNLLRDSVNIVLHNAWMVNFNQPLKSFDPLLEGTRRLLQLTEKSRHHAEFHFVSSIAVVSGRTKDIDQIGSIPETLHDASIVLQQGYAESKFVAENLCKIFAQQGRSTIAIHRVGQLGGPRNSHAGMWTLRDWLPALVQSSQTMGELPDSLGSIPVDWVPIDVAAQSIIEIIGARNRPRSSSLSEVEVYHITNPHTSSWKPLARILSQSCAAKEVPLDQWVQNLRIRSSAANSDLNVLRDLPAAQLLDFFTALLQQPGWTRPPAETANAQKYSAAMRALEPVDAPLMELWLQQWKDSMPGLKV